jgi:hypothetical protein
MPDTSLFSTHQAVSQRHSVNTPHEIWMTRAILCSVRKELPLRNSKFRGNCNRECGVVSPSLAKEGRGTIFNAEKLFSNQHVLFCHCIVFFQLVTWEHTFRNNGLSPCTVTRSEFCNSTRSLIRLPHPPRTSLRPSIPQGARKTVPSLFFLIRHQPTSTNLIFDLGLRRDRTQYPSPIQKHLLTREPLSTEPDVKASIEKGGFSLEEIHFVILSHLHWDHIGTPSDFTKSTFIVGPGSLDLLRHGGDVSKTGSHSHFERDLLPTERRSNSLLLEGSHLRIRKYNSQKLQIYNGSQLRISHTQSISLKTGASSLSTHQAIPKDILIS